MNIQLGKRLSCVCAGLLLGMLSWATPAAAETTDSYESCGSCTAPSTEPMPIGSWCEGYGEYLCRDPDSLTCAWFWTEAPTKTNAGTPVLDPSATIDTACDACGTKPSISIGCTTTWGVSLTDASSFSFGLGFSQAAKGEIGLPLVAEGAIEIGSTQDFTWGSNESHTETVSVACGPSNLPGCEKVNILIEAYKQEGIVVEGRGHEYWSFKTYCCDSDGNINFDEWRSRGAEYCPETDVSMQADGMINYNQLVCEADSVECPEDELHAECLPDAGVDASVDAGVDASVDSGTDSGVDSGTDSGVDSGTDSGVDSGVDASTDSGVDASTDSGVDASTDSGAGDGGLDATTAAKAASGSAS